MERELIKREKKRGRRELIIIIFWKKKGMLIRWKDLCSFSNIDVVVIVADDSEGGGKTKQKKEWPKQKVMNDGMSK